MSSAVMLRALSRAAALPDESGAAAAAGRIVRLMRALAARQKQAMRGQEEHRATRAGARHQSRMANAHHAVSSRLHAAWHSQSAAMRRAASRRMAAAHAWMAVLHRVCGTHGAVPAHTCKPSESQHFLVSHQGLWSASSNDMEGRLPTMHALA